MNINMLPSTPEGSYTTGKARRLLSSSMRYAKAPSLQWFSKPLTASPGLNQQNFAAPCLRKYGLTISWKREASILVSFRVTGLPN